MASAAVAAAGSTMEGSCSSAKENVVEGALEESPLLDEALMLGRLLDGRAAPGTLGLRAIWMEPILSSSSGSVGGSPSKTRRKFVNACISTETLGTYVLDVCTG